MKLNKLTLKDRQLVNKYLSLRQHELSVYVFENIYLWNKLFEINWSLINNHLCIFFKDRLGSFLYLPPLGNVLDQETLREALDILDNFNKNKEISRIENIEKQELKFYQNLGFTLQAKMPEYLYPRRELVELRGNRFKHKRASCNYFVRNNKFQYLPFQIRYKKECLRLYQDWMKERVSLNSDRLYQMMLEDGLLCLENLFNKWDDLSFKGMVVKIDKQIRGFTLGFKINKNTFCINYEIADLAFKGIAQFIFRTFCQSLKNYKYINVMDDSGLENLKKVKLSYRPIKLVPAYIAKRPRPS